MMQQHNYHCGWTKNLWEIIFFYYYYYYFIRRNWSLRLFENPNWLIFIIIIVVVFDLFYFILFYFLLLAFSAWREHKRTWCIIYSCNIHAHINSSSIKELLISTLIRKLINCGYFFMNSPKFFILIFFRHGTSNAFFM